MEATPCGAPTRAGGQCRYPTGECPWKSHRGRKAAQSADQAPPAEKSASEPVPPLATEHDVRALAWWLVEQTVKGTIEMNRASVLGTLLRTLAALGPAPADEDEALAEVELRGVLMNGMPPRDDEEWTLAARIFDDDALAEFRRWGTRSGEGAD